MTLRTSVFAGIALLSAFPALVLGAASLQPANLRCEYRKNPLGIDVLKPRLSWTLTARDASAKNLKQSAYRIMAASSEAALQAGKGDLWDSGKISSEQSIHVEYAGRPLSSGQPVHWKVQVWDQNSEASNWSQPAMWSMGLLQEPDWKAKWIGLDEAAPLKPQSNSLAWLKKARWIWSSPSGVKAKRYFRTEVNIPSSGKLIRATYVIAAESSFSVSINGRQAGRGNLVQLPEVLDVTPYLKPGANAIAIEATGANAASKPSGLIGSLHIETTTGAVELNTNSKWQVAESAQGASVKATELGAYGMPPWGETGYAELRILPARYLRKEFPIEPRIRRATAYFTGLGLSELYINGKKISDDVLSPALTSYDQRAPYVTYDVTRQLKQGTNAVGVILGNGRYWAPRVTVPTKTLTYGSPKMRLQIAVEYENGKSAILASDESWKLTANGPIRANNEYDGEEYDARLEMAGWAEAGFREDTATWKPAQLVKAASPQASAIPSEPIRVMETLKPLSVKQVRPGVYIFDMGQNMVGWCKLTLQGPKGTQVSLRHSETLREDGSLYLDNLRSARVQDLYTLKGGGVETWEPRFTYHGFRYVEVTGYPGEPKITSLQGRVVHDAVANAGEFVTSNSLLNAIHKNIYWGTRGNYRSVPTDCPQRDERQGWLGDRAEESRGEMYLLEAGPLYAKFMTDIADSQRPTGSIPDLAPAYWPFYNDSVTWPGSFVIFPQALYELYGDRRVIERNYPAMKKWMDYMAGFMKDGVMPKDMYGDWCVPPERLELIHSQDPQRKTEAAVLGSTYYYYTLQLMSGYARLLGKEDDARRWTAMATSLRNSFNAKFLNGSKNSYSNGSQTSSILPLFFDMVPKENRTAVFQFLTGKIEKETNEHVGTGLVGGQWLMRTLSDNGRADLAFRIANQKSYPSWGYMIGRGATTVWELWNGDKADPAMNSGNHLMLIGDLNIWFYEYLAGIRPDSADPAFHHTIIHPTVIGDLQFVRASHRSPYGEIRSEWKRDGKDVTLSVTIPPNTTATVHVPGGQTTNIGSGSYVFHGKAN